MKVLIENAVPLNNGDAALIFSIGQEFEKRGDTVYYSTFHYKKVKRKYPEKNWLKSPLTKRRITKIPVINTIYLSLLLVLNPLYRKFDAVVSAPGGYINSFYGIEKKLLLLRLYKRVLKKPVYMYSQSIGPLNEKDKKRLEKSMKHFNLFYVRDDRSMERINELGRFEQVFQTKDAAFLLPIKEPKNSSEKQKIGISVRRWTENMDSVEIFKRNMEKIVRFFIQNNLEITFISTCQGEEGYPDDSLIAEEIVANLKAENVDTELISIDNSSYTLNTFISKLSHFDLVIGTRLHMCILSWMNGVPAFNISYEEKGRECFRYLGIEKYCVEYGDQNEDLLDKIAKFSEDPELIHVFDRVSEIHQENTFFFEKMYEDIKQYVKE